MPTLKMHKEAVDKLATTSSSQSSTDGGANHRRERRSTGAWGQQFHRSSSARTSPRSGLLGRLQLVKDDQGIWRGKAMKDGKEVPIALDYQGNVVSETK